MSPDISAGKDVQNGSAEPTTAGPPVELPDVVPDFVGEVHSTINEALATGTDRLGAHLGDLLANAAVGEAVGVVPDVASAIPL
ncbi:MAG: hypothetical protein ACOCUO_02475 [archaeon]